MAKRWAQFDQSWTYRLRPRMHRDYVAGQTYFMPLAAFEKAVAAGVAHEVEKPEGEAPAKRSRKKAEAAEA